MCNVLWKCAKPAFVNFELTLYVKHIFQTLNFSFLRIRILKHLIPSSIFDSTSYQLIQRHRAHLPGLVRYLLRICF